VRRFFYVKYSLFMSDFNESWIFWKDFSKKKHITNFMKIRPVRIEFFYADRQARRN